MQLVDQFSRYQRGRGFSTETIRRRRRSLLQFARHLEPKTLERATLADIEEWLLGYRAARTRHAYRSDLRTFYGWATARDLLPLNPAALVDPVKVPKSLPRPIGDEVLAAMYTGSLRVRRMIGLGLLAGLRAGEIAALDASDVALHTKPPTIVVRAGKGGKDRVIPAHPMLVELLAGIPAGPVFANQYGEPIKSKSCSQTIRAHLVRCGISATAHQLRHTFGTEMARAAKGNLLAVANVMGHGSMNTTRGYVGWSGEAEAIIADMFRPAAA